MENYRILYIFLILICNCIASCEVDSSERKEIIFSNDLENASGWESPVNSSIFLGDAHSGRFFARMTTENKIGYCFKSKFENISKKPLKELRASAWFLFKNPLSTASFVVIVMDSSEKIVFKQVSVPASNYVKIINDWKEVPVSIDLSKVNQPKNILTVFACDSSATESWVDDYKLLFYEQ